MSATLCADRKRIFLFGSALQKIGIPSELRGGAYMPGGLRDKKVRTLFAPGRLGKGMSSVILIIGAAASGKRAFAETLGYRRADMADACLDDRPVLFNLQDLVWRDPGHADALLPGLLKKEAVLCDEVGGGIVPVDQNDFAARRAVGKLCILLAGRADCVVRVVCGIPTVIKGTLR